MHILYSNSYDCNFHWYSSAPVSSYWPRLKLLRISACFFNTLLNLWWELGPWSISISKVQPFGSLQHTLGTPQQATYYLLAKVQSPNSDTALLSAYECNKDGIYQLEFIFDGTFYSNNNIPSLKVISIYFTILSTCYNYYNETNQVYKKVENMLTTTTVVYTSSFYHSLFTLYLLKNYFSHPESLDIPKYSAWYQL